MWSFEKQVPLLTYNLPTIVGPQKRDVQRILVPFQPPHPSREKITPGETQTLNQRDSSKGKDTCGQPDVLS